MLIKKQTYRHTWKIPREHWKKHNHKHFQAVSLFLFKTELSDGSYSAVSLPIPVHCRSQRTGSGQNSEVANNGNSLLQQKPFERCFIINNGQYIWCARKLLQIVTRRRKKEGRWARCIHWYLAYLKTHFNLRFCKKNLWKSCIV